jgi:hypothetical protein
MSNFTYGTSTVGNTTINAWGGVCTTHGSAYCGCNNFGGVYSNWIQCLTCNQWYDASPAANQHICMGAASPWWNTTIGGQQSTVFPVNGIWTIPQPLLKELKEITTDGELTYVWNGGSCDMRLPAKFGDCFLKVGTAWSPLYPLIFSAFENDEKAISFHLIINVQDKTFEGDQVVLKGVVTTKIEDNLTLLQLTSRVRDFFKEDDKTNPVV